MDDTLLIRPSATVVLVRDGGEAPEVFMVRRHEHASFGDAHAFPGGVVEPADGRVHDFCDGLDSADANLRLGVASGGLDYYAAAIRELFEESGVLLADVALGEAELLEIRDGLNDGSLHWAEVVAQHDLRLRCLDLSYVSHWVTPPGEPKRYSTRFFVAAMPDHQEAVHCGGELTDSFWATPSAILKAARDGKITLIYPTLKTLESLERHASLSELLDWARSSVDWGITSMVPQIIERDGKQAIVLPGDKDYPGNRT